VTPRDKALDKILSLRRLAEHANTPPHEAESARGRIKVLRDKYGISDSETKPKPPPPPNGMTAEEMRRWWFNFTQSSPTPSDVRRDQARRNAADRLRRERQQAQERWNAKMRDKDDLGRPRTAEDKRKAQEDPLGWAASQDKRTHAQKQEDLNNARGAQDRENFRKAYEDVTKGARDAADRKYGRVHIERCKKPETYFDPGGNPRPRNKHVIQCDRCSVKLQPGDGTIFEVGGRWFGRCCEMVPGPRKKRF
jgi:hypothetical protein